MLQYHMVNESGNAHIYADSAAMRDELIGRGFHIVEDEKKTRKRGNADDGE